MYTYPNITNVIDSSSDTFISFSFPEPYFIV